MSLSKEDIKLKYPIPVYNYRVVVDDQEMAFSEVSGLSITYGEVILYKHGLSFQQGEFMQRIGNSLQKQKPANLTLKRGIIRGNNTLYNWLNTIKSMIIYLCDEEGNPLVSWKVGRAMATRLSAPVFDAEANQVAIESLEVFAKDIEVTYEN